MKNQKLFWILLLIISLQSSCEKKSNPTDSSDDNIPKTQLKLVNQVIDVAFFNNDEIAIDTHGNVWYVQLKDSPNGTSSDFPFLCQLCMFDGTNHYLMYDDIKHQIHKIVFDKLGNFWLMNSNEVMKINTQHVLSTEFELGMNDGTLQTIAVDNRNNVWFGGWNTGVYRYYESNYLQYTSSNSDFASPGPEIIYADNYSVWFGLVDRGGLMRYVNNKWIHYKNPDTDITLEAIYGLKIDLVGNLWIGTGFWIPEVTLLRFDGTKFEDFTPKDSTGENVPGIIQKIRVDNSGNVWVVSEKLQNKGSCYIGVETKLSVFDGTKWTVMENATDGAYINDLEIYNNQIFLATRYKIYVMNL